MRTIVTILFAATLAAPSASSQESGDTAARAKTIAPFLDEGAVALVRIDLTRVDVDALVADLVQLVQRAGANSADKAVVQQDIDTLKERGREAGRWVADFQKAGGKDLYCVLTTSQGPVFAVVPLLPGADRESLTKWLSDRGFKVVERMGEALYAGGKSPPKQKLEPPARPYLADAFAAAGDMTAQVLVVPTFDMRRVADAMLPGLSSDNDRIPTTAITRGLVWAAIGLEIRPAWSVKLVIQSEDPPAAVTLNVAIGEILKALRQISSGEHPIPNIDAIVALLTPAVDGDHLRLALDDRQAKTLAGDAILPLFRGTRRSVASKVSMSNIRALVQACLIYCNDHQENWPEKLQTLLDEKRIGSELLVNPRHPDNRLGYVYVKPAAGRAKRNTSAIVVIHEAYETSGEGINVGFADGHVEFINDMTHFEKLLADTKAQNNPSATQQAAPSIP